LRAYTTQSELSSLVWAASNTAESLDTCRSLDEVRNYFLAGMRVSPEELREHVSEDPLLRHRLRVEDGLLARRGREDLVERRQVQIRASARNKRLANQRSWILTEVSPFLEMLAITGSTAYHSADPCEDIDLFVFAERRRLWINNSNSTEPVRYVLKLVLGLVFALTAAQYLLNLVDGGTSEPYVLKTVRSLVS
jgi:hypothetical protein